MAARIRASSSCAAVVAVLVAQPVGDVLARGCRRTGSPPAAPAPRGGAGRRRRCRAGPRRRAAPRRAVGSMNRATSLAIVVLPDPVAPTTATDVPGGDRDVDVAQHRRAVRVGEVHRRAARRAPGRAGWARRPRRRRPPRPASRGPRARGASPATAFCSSLRISVAICTGPVKSWTRKRKASSWPTDISPAMPEVRARRRRPRARTRLATSTPLENTSATRFCARTIAARVARDRGVDPALRALGDPVRADGLGADDGLGDGAEHRADPLAHRGVPRVDALLQRPQQRRTAARSPPRRSGSAARSRPP